MKLTESQKAAVLFTDKQIRMIDASSSNCWYFHFSDGSVACIDGTELRATTYACGVKHEPEISW